MNAKLNYSTAHINRNYLIKVYGTTEDGKKINKLVGVTGLIELIGVDFANKFIERTERAMADLCVCKLRRGLKVTFYSH